MYYYVQNGGIDDLGLDMNSRVYYGARNQEI